MKEKLKLLIVYDASTNEYTISDHNLEPQQAAQFVKEWQPHLRSGCSFMSLDQQRRHNTLDAQNCRACRDQVRRSSDLQSPPTFKRREE